MHCANRCRSPARGFVAHGQTSPWVACSAESVPSDRWCAPAGSCGRADRCRGSRRGAEATVAVTGPDCSVGHRARRAGTRLRCGQRFGGRFRRVRVRAAGRWPRAGCPAAAPAGWPPDRKAGGRGAVRRRRRCGLTRCRHPDDHLAGVDDRRCGPGGPCAGAQGCHRGSACVQRWRRNTCRWSGFAHHDPVPRRILNEMGGSRGTGSFRARGRTRPVRARPALPEHRARGLPSAAAAPDWSPGIAQLVGPLGCRGRQPQSDGQPQPQRADDQHHERDLWPPACVG